LALGVDLALQARLADRQGRQHRIATTASAQGFGGWLGDGGHAGTAGGSRVVEFIA
jgi:hypothetical protein